MNKYFNITAQVYKTEDHSKQTVLMNDVIKASNQQSAVLQFYGFFPEYEVVKIYSVEEVSQDET